MDRPPPDKAILLALAALYRLAAEAREVPLPPSLTLRALLAFLHAHSRGDVAPYTAFWRHCREPYAKEHASAGGYMRANYARTAWAGIVRSLGLEPQSGELHETIRRLIATEQPATADPHAVMSAALRDAVYVREVIATKGRPKSQRGRELAASIIEQLR